MPIIPEHYERMDWLPCPECWEEDTYQSEMWVVDTHGILKDASGEPVIDPDWPNLDDPTFSEGVIVTQDTSGGRTFQGCPNCGGTGECYKLPGDDCIGKSWNQWVLVEGDITEGTGKVRR